LHSPARKPRPLVIKIGGSLAGGTNLGGWIDALKHGCAAAPAARQSQFIICALPISLANAVRKLQGELDFDDHAAHHMALLAMEQFGLALASLWPRLTRVETLAAIHRAWRMRLIPWWAPTQMTLASPVPARSWQMTSDSLAAWLAGEVKAARLLLIKSVEAGPEPEAICADLVTAGIVDPLFGHFAATSGAELYVAGPSALPGACAILAEGGAPGVRVRLS
jgi:dihydroneopterin aldolase